MPHQSFQYPTKSFIDQRRDGSCTRKCHQEWLEKYDCLLYCVERDGLFCLSCVLFPLPGGAAKCAEQRSNILIKVPLNNWKKATEYLKEHESKQYHTASLHIMDKFKHVTPENNITTALIKEGIDKIKDNRLILSCIVECLKYLGRQGIALQGHRDAGIPNLTNMNDNMGNFKELIRLVALFNPILSDHLQTCSKAATYISKTTQNKLLNYIKEGIQLHIVTEVKSELCQNGNYFFGIMADEVKDASNWEQLGLILRYVKNGHPIERFVEFVGCADTTGEAIAENIISVLANLFRLTPNYMIIYNSGTAASDD